MLGSLACMLATTWHQTRGESLSRTLHGRIHALSDASSEAVCLNSAAAIIVFGSWISGELASSWEEHRSSDKGRVWFLEGVLY